MCPEHEKKDETLDAEAASGIVTWSLQYTEAGSRINLWPYSGYRGPIIVVQKDTIQDCY